MRVTRRSALALGASLTLTACGPRRPGPMTAFDGRLSDWTREILADSPELASLAGVSEAQAGGSFSARLDDRSPAAVDARRGAALRRYAELRALDGAQLSPAAQLTHAVLEQHFGNAVGVAAFNFGRFAPLDGAQPYVLNQLDSAFIGLPSFLDERQGAGDDAEIEAYLQRLSAVATAIDQETAHARADAAAGVRAPGFIMDATAAVLDEILRTPLGAQPYLTSLAAKLGAQPNAAVLARAQAIVGDAIVPAHQRALAFLRSDRANASEDAGVWRLPAGEDYYAAALKLETTTALSPAQVHAIGRERVGALTRALDIALRRVGLTDGEVGPRLAALSADPRHRYPDSDEGRAQLIADVQGRVARMLERAPQWFGRLPSAGLEVRRVPTFAEASQPGAYYNSPSLDGQTPGIYYVNLRDLSEMTRVDLPTQDYHEAVPGHHFQVALAQELTDAPLIRRLVWFNAYSEGWGLYAEELADELGFYDGDPVGRIGFLRWQLWRAARLVVDTGLHAERWTRQQAIDYLTQVTGDAPGTIATEVDRYVVWPGQACGYELGRREIARLRETARNALGPDFDLRGFHNAVLLNGEVPLSVLGDLVRDWIPEQRRLAERERRRR